MDGTLLKTSTRPLATATPGAVFPNPVRKLAGLRVLAVDDQPDVRDLLVTVLHLQGAEVQTAGSVAEAMKVLAGWQPDVVVSDIAMPGGDGYELVRRLRNSGYTMPAIALTAHAGSQDRIHALSAGFQTHLPKPIEPYELVLSIANLTGRSSRKPGAENAADESPLAKFDLSSGVIVDPRVNR